MSSPQKCIRLSEPLLKRIEAYAKAQGIKFSAALRIALQRGVSAIERETDLLPAQPQRRKVISKGVY